MAESMTDLKRKCSICDQDVFLGSGENLDIEGQEYMQDYLICSPQCPNDGKWVE